MPLFDHFGLIAPFYDRAISLRTVEHLLEHLALPVDGRLLDAGGGTGRVAQALRQHARQVVVADESLGMLRQARRKDGLALALSRTERLPFPDASFERVLMVDALHHVAGQSATAGELWRVLRPGGRIVIEEPDVRKLAVKLVALAEKLALMRSYFLSPPQISALFPQDTARTHIVRDGFIAWVIVEKAPF